jgi:hypothetical protein
MSPKQSLGHKQIIFHFSFAIFHWSFQATSIRSPTYMEGLITTNPVLVLGFQQASQ